MEGGWGWIWMYGKEEWRIGMRIPEFIREGDCLGFVAPSFGCNIEPYKSAFQNGLEKFQKMGFQVDLGPNCYAGEGIGISNTPQKCGEEINTYFSKKGVRALFSCGGGELMCEVLDYIDFEKISKEEPKWYMGFSDNTNLTFLLATLCDTAAVYGPNAPAFGMEPWHESLADAYAVLRGERTEVRNYPCWEKESLKDEGHPLEPYHVTEPACIRSFPGQGFTVSGRLLGGCLDSLGNLVGTKYDKVSSFLSRYGREKILWYMEACKLNVMDIRRKLWQLDGAGWFETAGGFLFGRPQCIGEELFGLDEYSAVTGILAKYNVPILMDLDIGHIPPMMPVVNGAFATVHSTGSDILLRYDFEK